MGPGDVDCLRADGRNNWDCASLDDGPYGDAAPGGTILGMALKPLSASELAEQQTLFASFMGDMDTSYKTLGQLRAIYRERSEALHAAEDQADDLRVDRFRADMASDRWDADVVMRIGVFDGSVLVIDGIHRGIAYLACIEEGISPARLPALHVDC
jgi:hypothetical protein